MANCSDNSYIIYYTNLDKGTIQIRRSVLVVDELDIALIGKSRLEYGEIFNENILHLLENFACPESSDTPGTPDTTVAFGQLLENPAVGQVWYNKTQKKPFVYTDANGWMPIGSIQDVSGNSGVLGPDIRVLPLPMSKDGEYTFKPEECVWNVSPYYLPDEVDFVDCFTYVDGPNVKVTMDYRLSGNSDIISGYVNFQILGIRDNVNLGTVDCQSIVAPTPTPAVSNTPVPSVTPTPTESAVITPSPTVTMTPSLTPTITPTPTEDSEG